MAEQTINRKLEHLLVSLGENVETWDTAWFQEITLIHNPLPDFSLDDVDIELSLWGRTLKAPLVIEGMTGGHPIAKKVNAKLARVAQRYGIAIGVGSQRAALERRELRETFSVVRELAPDTLVIANIGASQLAMGYCIEKIVEIIDMVNADALAIHFNVLHEAVQPEGEPHYNLALYDRIKELCKSISIPVILKETGTGFSREAALKALNLGVNGVDIGGRGGTSFALVEHYRASCYGIYHLAEIAKIFSSWGVPTAISICEVRSVADFMVIASGGVRTGIDVAKAIALGANLAGFALPLLRVLAREGEKGVEKFIEKAILELKISMLCSGARRIVDLLNVPLVVSTAFRNWLEQRGISLKNVRERGRKSWSSIGY